MQELPKEPVLPVWQELRIRAQPKQIEEFLEFVDNHLPSGWVKSDEDIGGSIDRHGYWLKAFGVAGLKFWLWKKKPTELFLQNIVPQDVRDNPPSATKIEEYNRRLLLFKNAVIDPASKAVKVAVILESDQKTMEDLTSPEIANRLRSFSRCANKSTSNSHPNDAERWALFVFSVHEDTTITLDGTTLQEWLESDGWTHSTASSLALEYENSLQLLRFYDRYKSGKRLWNVD